MRASFLIGFALTVFACGDDTNGSGGAGGASSTTSGSSTTTSGDTATSSNSSSASTGGDGGSSSSTSNGGAGQGDGGGDVEAFIEACEALAAVENEVSADLGCPQNIPDEVCADEAEEGVVCMDLATAYLRCKADNSTARTCECDEDGGDDDGGGEGGFGSGSGGGEAGEVVLDCNTYEACNDERRAIVDCAQQSEDDDGGAGDDD